MIWLILLEAALVTLMGGILGWAAGTGSASVLAPRLAGVSMPVVPSASLALGSVLGALVVGVVASLYPAVRAAQLDPTIALRSL